MQSNRSARQSKRAPRRPKSVAYSAAQTRIIAAALELFAEHGVNGTSLQMIADAIGVTKAAVYHQFNTKDEIILAVAEADLARLEVAIEAAEAEPSRPRALEVLLSQMIDLAVERRRTTGTYQGDPVMVRFLAGHKPFRLVMDRLYRLLARDAGAGARVRAAAVSAAVGAVVMHPLVADLDDDALRTQLEHLAKSFARLLE